MLIAPNVGNCFCSGILNDCIKDQEKKKKFASFSRPRQNVKLGTFTLYVAVQGRLRNVQKSVMYVQSSCFANLNLLLFCRSRWRRCRRCLSSLYIILITESFVVAFPMVTEPIFR